MRTSLRSDILRCSASLTLAVATLGCAQADAAPVLPPPVVGAGLQAAATADTAVFAGGCFWGVEAVFRHVRGVSSAVSGYAGGTVAGPSYEQVSNGSTGHAEAVQVVYDPRVVAYGALLRVFFSVAHDPTELNRQGPDVGTQYRSAIFTRNKEQGAAVTAYIGQLTAAGAFRNPIVTEVAPLTKFWKAESYHQNYLASHRTQPYIVYNDLPKLDALKRQFAELYREDGIAAKE
ncbi:MAG TPA: peptide-methionine (S)-S-oxide reductase MsrA [Gemmatimonas sp.]|nr:peptide-methionine (S)-S-oxide reductase MsrA [Gemmatimonas sp.]